MKLRLLFLFILPLVAGAQLAHTPESIIKNLAIINSVPEGLLAERSVVLYDNAVSLKELEEAQKAFQQTGIDAVAHFENNRVLAGADPQQAFAKYLNARSISFIILFTKSANIYSFTFFRFNRKANLFDAGSSGWQQSHASLKELLLTIFRFAVSNQKKQNLLVNDFPETGNAFKYFDGRRSEVYSALVKSFKIAVPSFGNERDDAQLDQILKEHLPLKYEIVNAGMPEAELEIKGFKTIIRYVHTTGTIGREILEYDSKTGNALASAAIVNNEAQLKTIPANSVVYKFYVKQLEYGNLFLGNKWDADTDWQQALINHLYLMRQQLNY